MKHIDKVKHGICGAIAAVLGALVLALAFGTGYLPAFVCGVLCAFAAGAAAEFKDMAYNWSLKCFDLLDLMATVAGGAVGAAAGACITLV